MELITSSGLFASVVGVLLNLALGACTTVATEPMPVPAASATAIAATATGGTPEASGQLLPTQQSTSVPSDEVTPSPTVTFIPLITSTPRAVDIPADLSDLEVYMEKTACEGPCPVYSVSVRGDGTVLYNGKTCVNVVGEQTDQISQEAVRDLVEAFYQNDFFSLEDAYIEDVQDIPAILIRFSLGDQTKQVVKQVYDPNNAPAELERIEDSIDTIANTQQWVTTDGTTVPCP